MIFTVVQGCIKTIKLLLGAKAGVIVKGCQGKTVWTYAFMADQDETAKLLEKAGSMLVLPDPIIGGKVGYK